MYKEHGSPFCVMMSDGADIVVDGVVHPCQFVLLVLLLLFDMKLNDFLLEWMFYGSLLFCSVMSHCCSLSSFLLVIILLSPVSRLACL